MIEFWHNPRCSKSRQALALLEERGAELTVRRYLDDAPTRAQILAAWNAMGRPPIADMMRTGEARFSELGLSKSDNDDRLLDAMAENPVLIERPVAIRNNHAVIGRPPEKVLELL